MDCVLIQHGKAYEIWRETSKASLVSQYAPTILSAIVETASGAAQSGDLWDGNFFSVPPVTPAPSLRETAHVASRQREILVTCAMFVRAKLGVTAWNKLSTQEKIDQTVAAANEWEDLYTVIAPRV